MFLKNESEISAIISQKIVDPVPSINNVDDDKLQNIPIFRFDKNKVDKNKKKYSPRNTSSDSSKKKKKKRSTRTLFTDEEDRLLEDLMNNKEFTKWSEVAVHFSNRNARQVRDRWTNYLNVKEINNGPWTPEEDLQLAELYNEYGPKWATISKFFDKRRENNVKNRWYSNLRTSTIVLNEGIAKYNEGISVETNICAVNKKEDNKNRNDDIKGEYFDIIQNEVVNEKTSKQIEEFKQNISKKCMIEIEMADEWETGNENIESKYDLFGEWDNNQTYFSELNTTFFMHNKFVLW